ncbi:MAG TPA: NAD(P)/FAD-dependent oxidoreductase, partial [candidate division Zixibacteria bacterium]|nr:NAD(P)/FAD-dependent oxidoreductase [candidate division Zixibacteria bacterium]
MNAGEQILVIGGGFGGLHAVRALKRAPVEITLVDRENYHLFQPLLYQVATGGLSPADIASPLRSVLKRQRNVRTLMGEAVDIDPERRVVRLKDGRLSYDTLIVATGAHHNYFGHDEWERLAPGLKTVDDATAIRARLLSAFERAERESSPEERRALMTIVIVGGGPTGAELAGAIAEISRDTLRQDFRAIDPAATKIILVQGGDRILPSYPEPLSREAHRALESLGVEVRVGGFVTDVTDDGVTITRGARTERIATRTTLWAAGVRASSFGRRLAEMTGAQVDDVGRIVIDPSL